MEIATTTMIDDENKKDTGRIIVIKSMFSDNLLYIK